VTHERAGAEAASADERRAIRVAGAQRDLLGRNAQNIRNKLGKDGLVPLAGRARQREKVERAIGVEANRDLLLADAAGRLDEDRAADAPQFATPFCISAPTLEAPPIGFLQRLLQKDRRSPLS
jgi:hypothetical protein